MDFREELSKRILILDGAMGTMIQGLGKGGGSFNSELLTIDAPWLIRQVHEKYIEAGADIISTDSFGANRLVQDAHGLGEKASLMARNAASIARSAADAAGRKVWVAGSAGPTGKSLTLASDASDPGFRAVEFDAMSSAYEEQFRALEDGGADLILLETCFDALNVKAAVYALEKTGTRLPLIISATVSDRSGRTLTGQTLEAFYQSVHHASCLTAFGVNCALGAAQMTGLVEDIASFSSHPVSFYPNAGLPDALGHYADSPRQMAEVISSLAAKGLLNIVGGCCGTRPEHILAIRDAVRPFAPRPIPDPRPGKLTVSGLEAVSIDPERNFTNVGERTNVAGSKKFARLIAQGDFTSALRIASDQVEGGAGIIDINMDDPMLEPTGMMVRFLRHIAGEPSIAKAALMIDSSHWDTIVAGLKNAQGKCIVNSISLKEGPQEFVRKALEIRRLGAAMVVMAFDEEGQATSLERKTQICARAYRLLTEQGIEPSQIIFDCNILTIGTGIPGHARFGVDFIEAVRWIKANLPGALTSGGVSNLSFAFRGNSAVREAMHSAFLYHAVQAGLDMAIVNPQMLQVYSRIEPGLLKAVEDVIFDRDGEATARLVELAGKLGAEASAAGSEPVRQPHEDIPDVRERLRRAVVSGQTSLLAADLEECLGTLSAVQIVEGPLMAGMEEVGELFSCGKMFLPQVVKSASVMRDAVAILKPHMGNSDEGGGTTSSKPRFLIATVQGDVHDIGKNITAIVLECSGFEVTDLGVMVPSDTILSEAARIHAHAIGVSALISPSLARMEELCTKMTEAGLDIPLFVGGAAASAVHTAVRLEPLYANVHYGADASATAVMAKKYLMDPEGFRKSEAAAAGKIRELYEAAAVDQSDGRACADTPALDAPPASAVEDLWMEIPARELLPLVDWKLFATACGIKGVSPDGDTSADRYAAALKEEALAEVPSLTVRLAARFYPALRDGDCIAALTPDGRKLFRMAPEKGYGNMAHWYSAESERPVGVFAATAPKPCGGQSDPAGEAVSHALRAALADAASEFIKSRYPWVRFMAGIGYNCCPDHSAKKTVLELLPPELGISLTESFAMTPEESVCGLCL